LPELKFEYGIIHKTYSMDSKNEKFVKSLRVIVKEICRRYILATIADIQSEHLGYGEKRFMPDQSKQLKDIKKGWDSFENVINGSEKNKAQPVTISPKFVNICAEVFGMISENIIAADIDKKSGDFMSDVLKKETQNWKFLTFMGDVVNNERIQQLLKGKNMSNEFKFIDLLVKKFKESLGDNAPGTAGLKIISYFYFDFMRVISISVGRSVWECKTYPLDDTKFLTILRQLNMVIGGLTQEDIDCLKSSMKAIFDRTEKEKKEKKKKLAAEAKKLKVTTKKMQEEDTDNSEPSDSESDSEESE
jgi:hypothetical protein